MRNDISINKNGELEIAGAKLNLDEFLDKLDTKPTIHVRAKAPIDFNLGDFWYDTTSDIFSIGRLVDGKLNWVELPFGISGSTDSGGSVGVDTGMLNIAIESLRNEIIRLNIKNVDNIILDSDNKELLDVEKIKNDVRRYKNFLPNTSFKLTTLLDVHNHVVDVYTNKEFSIDGWKCSGTGYKNISIKNYGDLNSVEYECNGGEDPVFYCHIPNFIETVQERVITYSVYVKSDLANPIEGLNLELVTTDGSYPYTNKEEVNSDIVGYRRFKLTINSENKPVEWTVSNKNLYMIIGINLMQNAPDGSKIEIMAPQLELGTEATKYELRTPQEEVTSLFGIFHYFGNGGISGGDVNNTYPSTNWVYQFPKRFNVIPTFNYKDISNSDNTIPNKHLNIDNNRVYIEKGDAETDDHFYWEDAFVIL